MNEEFVTILRNHLKYLVPDRELTCDVRLKDLGLDSMEAVNLMLDLEDEFQVLLDDDVLTAETFATPASLWKVIEQARSVSRPP